MEGHSREYDAYMRSANWESKRQQRLKIDQYKCVMCGRPASTCKNGLQVHHINYRRLTNENVFEDLVSLCPRCHRLIHNFYQRRRTA